MYAGKKYAKITDNTVTGGEDNQSILLFKGGLKILTESFPFKK